MRNGEIAAISSSGSVPVGQARTLSATSITSTDVTLNGSIDSQNGATTTVDFLYSTASDLAGATVVAATPSTVTTIGAAVSAPLSALSPGQVYYYAVKITNTGGTAQGLTLSTLLYPSATISSATSVNATTATLNGTVTSAGSSSTVVFEYATDVGFTSPVQVTAAQSPVVNGSSVVVSAAVTGLSPGQSYYVRLKATNTAGTTTSSSSSFNTLATAATNTVTTFGLTTATLLGTVTSVANLATVSFEYGTASDLTGATTIAATQSPLTGTNQSVSVPLTGLTTGATYYYRVKATTVAGTVFGSILSFVTYTTPTFGTQSGTSIPIAPSTSSTSFSNVSTTTATLVPSVGSGGSFYAYERLAGTAVTPSGNSLSGLAQDTLHTWRVNTTNNSSTVSLVTRVTPNGSTSTVSVVYGPTTSYGTNATSGGNTTVNIGSGTTEQSTTWALGTHSVTTYYKVTVTYFSGQTVTITGSIVFSQNVYNGTSTSFTTYGTRSYNSATHGASISVTKQTGYVDISSISGVLVGGGAGGYTTVTVYGSGGGGGGQYVAYSGRSTSTSLSLSRGAAGAGGQYGNATSLTDSAGTLYGNAGTPGGGGTGGQGGASPTGPGTYNFGYNPPSPNGIGGGGGGAGGAATSVDGGAASSGYGGGGPGYFDFGIGGTGYGTATNGPGRGGSGNNGSGTDGYWSVTYIGPVKN